MVLVDTNVWIEHFRSSSPKLIELLTSGKVVTNEFILGELSLAHFGKKERNLILERLHSLKKVPSSRHEDVYAFANKYKLAGKGIGWIDSHLLHTCLVNDIQLFTLDKSLAQLAAKVKRLS